MSMTVQASPTRMCQESGGLRFRNHHQVMATATGVNTGVMIHPVRSAYGEKKSRIEAIYQGIQRNTPNPTISFTHWSMGEFFRAG